MAKKRKRKENKSNGSTLYAHDKPKSTISEKFRGIRSNIMFSSANHEIKSLMITSEKPASGKSTITANVATTYAQAGYKTLIIDADLRKATQHYIFQLTNNSGLSNLLIGKALFKDAVKPTHIENLDLLTSGPVPPNPSELIVSDKFDELYRELVNTYDFVIFDTPPINTVTDAQLIARKGENCILVVDNEKNDRNEVKKARDLLIKAGGNVIGVVLNKTTLDKSSSYYYYYGDEK